MKCPTCLGKGDVEEKRVMPMPTEKVLKDMRSLGMSYREIGDRLGISYTKAWYLCGGLGHVEGQRTFDPPPSA